MKSPWAWSGDDRIDPWLSAELGQDDRPGDSAWYGSHDVTPDEVASWDAEQPEPDDTDG